MGSLPSQITFPTRLTALSSGYRGDQLNLRFKIMDIFLKVNKRVKCFLRN